MIANRMFKMNFFKKKSPPAQVIYDYKEACAFMKKIGVAIRPARSGRGSIISKDGLSWQFIGHDYGFMISRSIPAPASWNEDALVAWMYKKNFVVAVYDQSNEQFVIATHILTKGGVIGQNLTRLANNFDSSILSFIDAMKIDKNQIEALE